MAGCASALASRVCLHALCCTHACSCTAGSCGHNQVCRQPAGRAPTRGAVFPPEVRSACNKGVCLHFAPTDCSLQPACTSLLQTAACSLQHAGRHCLPLLTLNSRTRPHLSSARLANSSPSNAMSAWNLREGDRHAWVSHLLSQHSCGFLSQSCGARATSVSPALLVVWWWGVWRSLTRSAACRTQYQSQGHTVHACVYEALMGVTCALTTQACGV